MKHRPYVCRNERFCSFAGCGELPLRYGYHVVRNLPLGDFIPVVERQQLIYGDGAAFTLDSNQQWLLISLRMSAADAGGHLMSRVGVVASTAIPLHPCRPSSDESLVQRVPVGFDLCAVIVARTSKRMRRPKDLGSW
jgi:hypothetical protein